MIRTFLFFFFRMPLLFFYILVNIDFYYHIKSSNIKCRFFYYYYSNDLNWIKFSIKFSIAHNLTIERSSRENFYIFNFLLFNEDARYKKKIGADDNVTNFSCVMFSFFLNEILIVQCFLCIN